MRISDWSSDVCSSDLAFDLALAEAVAVLRDALGHAVAHERGRRGAAGGDAHPAADHGAAQRGYPELRKDRPGLQHHLRIEIGRASCRERVCQDVVIPVVAVSYKKQKNNTTSQH